MKNKMLVLFAVFCAFGQLADATRNQPTSLKEKLLEASLESSYLDDDDSDIDNRLIYKPYFVSKEIKRPESPKVTNNIIFNTDSEDLERDASEITETKVAPSSVVQIGSQPSEQKAKSAAGSIAFNSREVRLFGPGQKEVEMKDDTATKMMVALENLQKEATDVWGEVNKKLDKGWTDLKAMVEDALAKKPQASGRYLREADSGRDSLVVVKEADGYSLVDEGGIQKTSGDTGTKIKEFLSSVGLNEENQRKASEALSKAGTSISDSASKAGATISETASKAQASVSEMTKDLPDTLKKAGDSVSEAFKNVFG